MTQPKNGIQSEAYQSRPDMCAHFIVSLVYPTIGGPKKIDTQRPLFKTLVEYIKSAPWNIVLGSFLA